MIRSPVLGCVRVLSTFGHKYAFRVHVSTTTNFGRSLHTVLSASHIVYTLPSIWHRHLRVFQEPLGGHQHHSAASRRRVRPAQSTSTGHQDFPSIKLKKKDECWWHLILPKNESPDWAGEFRSISTYYCIRELRERDVVQWMSRIYCLSPPLTLVEQSSSWTGRPSLLSFPLRHIERVNRKRRDKRRWDG